MSAARISARATAARPEALVLLVVVALTAFFYGVRADVIGVRSPVTGWHAMTWAALPPTAHYVGSLLLLGVLPVLAAWLLLRLPPGALGLGLGRWQEGLLWLAAGVPIALLAARTGSGSDVMRFVYPLDRGVTPEPGRFLPYAGMEFLYYGSWEVLFRGVLLFGLRRRLGDGFANVLQTALSVLAHFGRAPDETFAAIPAGLLFGWVSLRLGSIWYIAILHWIVGAGVDWFLLS